MSNWSFLHLHVFSAVMSCQGHCGLVGTLGWDIKCGRVIRDIPSHWRELLLQPGHSIWMFTADSHSVPKLERCGSCVSRFGQNRPLRVNLTWISGVLLVDVKTDSREIKWLQLPPGAFWWLSAADVLPPHSHPPRCVNGKHVCSLSKDCGRLIRCWAVCSVKMLRGGH